MTVRKASKVAAVALMGLTVGVLASCGGVRSTVDSSPTGNESGGNVYYVECDQLHNNLVYTTPNGGISVVSGC